MDPNKALEELRAAIAELKAAQRDGASVDWDTGEIENKVIDRFEALDGWMSRGGFAPRAWKQHG